MNPCYSNPRYSRRRLALTRIQTSCWMLALLSVATPAFSQAPGFIAGTVRISAGTAVSGARVVAHRQGSRPLQSFSAATNADGSFTINNVPAGKYVLCVPEPGKGRQDPCIWATRPQQGEVTAGQTLRVPAITLPQTTTIRIRVQDPQQQLQRTSLDWRQPSIWFSVVDASGLRLTPSLTKREGATQTYELEVPQGRTYRLETASADVALQSAGGGQLARLGGADSFTVTANSQHEFTFIVSQRK